MLFKLYFVLFNYSAGHIRTTLVLMQLLVEYGDHLDLLLLLTIIYHSHPALLVVLIVLYILHLPDLVPTGE